MLLTLTLSVALARPTDGSGMWTYDESDTIVSWDAPGGRVRVWYSTSGTNAVLATDADSDGTPDFVEDVGVTAEEVLDGFRALGVDGPLPDHGVGGDDRLDAYLVDFAGNADGNWATEGCDGSACYGYFQMENDFSGYGYPSVDSAVRVLTSHELFHGVQAAYGSTDAVWFLEGTATWAEDYFEPEIEDFLDLCGGYLDDTGRSLNEPPSGPVPAFAYGTAIWWWFLTDRYGDDAMVDLLYAMGDSTDDDSLLAGMEAVEVAHGGTLHDDWVTFGEWNLATGVRAGTVESYPFAGELRGIKAEADGASVQDENRFYPLSTTYYMVETEAETPLWVATDAEGADLVLEVFPVEDNGDMGEKIATLAADAQAHDLGVSAPGKYWLMVSNPTLAANSTKLTVCFGAEADAAACAAMDDTGGDTADTGGDTADSGDAAGADTDTGGETPGGCACDHGGAPPSLAAGLAGAALILTRRRR